MNPADTAHIILLNEIRYAERLCLRTARLYRHFQTATSFLAVVGGSAALGSAVANNMPPWMPLLGALLLAFFGALAISVRPADKAAQNEMDAKRYAALRVKAGAMNANDLRLALNEARISDVAEIESLRDVAFNDVMLEIGQTSHLIPLNKRQQLFSVLA